MLDKRSTTELHHQSKLIIRNDDLPGTFIFLDLLSTLFPHSWILNCFTIINNIISLLQVML
jgi:hypothetical protein